MVFQVAVTHRMVLLLGNPSAAIALGVGGFLLAYGSGSYFISKGHRAMPAWLCSLMTALMIFAYTKIYYAFTASVLSLPVWARAFVTLCVIFPGGFLGGQLYPLGLRRVSEHSRKFIPMAIAIDGAAGCIAVILAPLLIEDFSFMAVGLLGACCYAFLGFFLLIFGKGVWSVSHNTMGTGPREEKAALQAYDASHT